MELALGAGRVAVDQSGRGLGRQPQREQLLADRVVQLMGEPGALLGDGELPAALVQPGVGEGDRRMLGEDRQQLLVLGGETAAALGFGAALVGEEERADDLVAVPDGQTEEIGHVGVGGGPALEAGVLADVGEALGPRLVEHRGEDAVLPGQGADGLPLLVADAVDDELGEAAVIVGHAQGGVLGVQQFAGRGDDRLQDVAHFEMPAHGEQRGTHRCEARRWAMAHGLTVPAEVRAPYRPVDGRRLGRRD